MSKKPKKSHAYLIDERFGDLVVKKIINDSLPTKEKEAECDCDCRGKKTTRIRNLIDGATKSCGCAKVDNDRIGLLSRNTFTHYSKGSITYDQFMILSQLPCVYCGAICGNKSDENKHIKKKKIKNISIIGKYNPEQFIFRYNGLDRVDSAIKEYHLDNVVPCCPMCNFAKITNQLSSFNSIIHRMIGHKIILSPEEHRNQFSSINTDFLDEKGWSALVSTIKARIRSYNSKNNDRKLDINFDYKIFYALSQLECYYCNVLPYRRAKGTRYIINEVKHSGDLIYNGIDCVDSSIGHLFDNVVSCCWDCNNAKSNYSVNEFLAWIDRLRTKWTGREITKEEIFVKI